METFMNEKKIKVLDIEIDNNTAKETMREIVEYMQTEPLNVVELVSADVLVKTKDNETLKDNIAQSDLVLAGEEAVLKLAQITDRRKLQEAQTQLFVKMVLQFFHKNRSRIFLLTESEEDQAHFREYLETYYKGIQIVGEAVLPNDSSADDMILNSINGAGADCVMSMVPAPVRETFVARNRILLNVNLWLGLGRNIHLPPVRKKSPVREFFVRRFLKREVEKERQKKRENA